MTRRLSPAEMDQQDAMTALRHPPTPQRMDPRDKTIAALQRKDERQKDEIKRLTEANETLREEKGLLLEDLNNLRAAHDRLRAMARAANDTERRV